MISTVPGAGILVLISLFLVLIILTSLGSREKL
jgi:hypothetical protein